MNNDSVQNLSTNNLVSKTHLGSKKKWIVAIMLIAFGTTICTDIADQWIPSYAKYIAHASYFQISIVVALSGILYTIFYIIWGTISDNLRIKMGRRVPMILVGSLLTAGLMIIFLMTVEYPILLVIAILIAVTSTMFHSTNKPMIADLVPPEKRGRVNTGVLVFSVVGSLAIWIPALVLLPESEGGFSFFVHACFIGGGALIVLLMGVLTVILVKEPKISTPPKSWTSELKSLLDRKEMAQHKNFLRFFVAMLFVIASQAAFFPFMLILLQEIEFEVEDLIVPLIFVGAGLGIGIVILGRATDKIGRKKVVLLSLIFSPIGFLIITFSRGNFLILIIGFAIGMSFNTGMFVATDSWTQDLLPEDSRGKFMGIINLGNAFGKIPGVLIAGLLADAYGILWVFLVAGIILWIAIPFFLRVPETIKRENEVIVKNDK